MSVAARRIDVLVVDDSRLMRRMIGDILAGMEMVGNVAFAPDALSARRQIVERRPDVITLDVEMPDLDGLKFLDQLMARMPLPVVMVSAITSRGAEATLRALERGAVDVVAKPTGLDGMQGFRGALVDAVARAAGARVGGGRAPAPVVPLRPPPVSRAPRRADIVGIAASTGGVTALAAVLPGLPPDAPPCLVTQHMPAAFLTRLAARLRARLHRDVAVAREGERLEHGMIRFAPGHRHLMPLERDAGMVTTLSDMPAPMGHTPSADLMFEGIARLRRPALGIILTGMGRDGAAGLRAMRDAGAATMGQDARSCVVYGMPRAAAELGALDEVLPPEAIAERLSTFWQPSPRKVSDII